jgi:hypothetical protein
MNGPEISRGSENGEIGSGQDEPDIVVIATNRRPYNSDSPDAGRRGVTGDGSTFLDNRARADETDAGITPWRMFD